MRFFNKMVLLYALIVIMLTLGYYYIAVYIISRQGNSGTFLFAAYLASIFAAALIINVKDHRSTYMGFNYHFITYLIAAIIPFIIVLWHNGPEKMDNIKSILMGMLIWGIGILFHLGLYLLKFRKGKVQGYQKDDLFQ